MEKTSECTRLNPGVRILTLKQPYASLVGVFKFLETRPETISWDKWRELVAIHAGAESYVESVAEAIELLSDRDGLPPELTEFVQTVPTLPTSSIVAIGLMTDSFIMTPESIARQTRLERACGNWQPGRKAIQFDEVMLLPEPIPFQGGQGLRWLDRVDRGLAEELQRRWIQAR